MATDRNKGDGDKQREISTRRLAGDAMSLGFGVVFCVIIGVVLDNTFKTAPVFILIGVFFALATIVYFLWRLVKAAG